MSMTKVKSFVREFVKAVQGDDAGVKAEKAFRQAESALKSQISNLEGATIDLEDKVTAAKESQAGARINNGYPITDRPYYVETLIKAKNSVTEAEKALSVHSEKISFLKAELKSLQDEVEA